MSIWVILFLTAVLSLALSLTFFALTETDGNSITANVGGDVEQCMLKVCQALCVLNVAGNVFFSHNCGYMDTSIDRDCSLHACNGMFFCNCTNAFTGEHFAYKLLYAKM